MNELNVNIPGGTYVIGVSGGVDSMVLLDILSKKSDIKLVVAHFDHGIRHDSKEDRQLVQSVAKKNRLPFVFDQASLGPKASEAESRKARYNFLSSVKNASSSRAIITAHHQDDVLETAVLNILRGTNRKGLSSLKSTDEIIRPLIHIDKDSLYIYAKDNGITWREDSTNSNINYRRNYIRKNILPKLSPEQRKKLLGIIKATALTNSLIDREVEDYLKTYSNDNELSRSAFILLPHSVALEIMASWLRQNGIRDFNSKLLELLTVSAKTLSSNHGIDINHAHFLKINRNSLALINREC